MRRRHELTDEPWNRIKDQLPGKATDPGRTATDNRLFVNAVLYVLKTATPPGSGKTCRNASANPTPPASDTIAGPRFRGAGVWERVAKALGDGELTDAIEER